MAPRKSRKSHPAAQAPATNEDDNTIKQSSQEAINEAMQRARSLVLDLKERREAQRQALEGELDNRIREVRVQLDAHFENRKSRVTKAQKAQWDRLELLNQKRQSIESLILSSMKAIEVQTANIASELDATFSGRVEEIKEGTP